MKRILILAVALAACAGTAPQALAQMPVPPPAPAVQLLSGPQLDQMLGPIALYPDPLLGTILPAATTPSDIVLADRYVNGGGDPSLIDQQPWSLSVKALARYPTLLKWMDDNLAWTTALGQAFLYQPQDVMDSVQRLRAQAMALGNLQSTPQENVFTDNGVIEILPADPNTLYLPVYQPAVVYFQRSYGPSFVSFGIGFAIGAWLNHDFDWHNHHLIVWRHDAPRPANWWARRPAQRPRIEAAHATVWQPRNHPGPAFNGLDRGWGAPQPRSTVTVIGSSPKPSPRPPAQSPSHSRSSPSTATVIGRSAPVQRSATPPARRPAAFSRSQPAGSSLIGVESARETRQFSNRGRESREAVSHSPAPQARSSAPAHSPASNHPAKSKRR